MTNTLLVFMDVAGEMLRVGTAFFTRRRQSLSTTFTYEPGYLADRRSFAIDPALVLAGGSHHVEELPGAFQDCAPDRWGRNLIAKRIRAEARQANRTPPSISDIDYLVGVSDLTRQGALRFKTDGSSSFLSPDHEVPMLIELPRLLHAAERVSRGDDDLAAVKDLLDAGTGSLGGARPKASVRGDDGRLRIAKFPHHHDDWDVTGWEKTALDLAGRSGIAVPGRQLMRVGRHRTLLVERFDRRTDGSRRPYISALTLVGGRDGSGLDYADVALHLEESSARAEADLADLFRRAVLSVAIRNTDDHLRNLGLLYASGGWRLSPAFDVNPNPDPAAPRQTTIGGAELPEDEPEGLMALAPLCHLSNERAHQLIKGVLDATTDWRTVAASNDLPASEIAQFEQSFDQQRHLLWTLLKPPH